MVGPGRRLLCGLPLGSAEVCRCLPRSARAAIALGARAVKRSSAPADFPTPPANRSVATWGGVGRPQPADPQRVGHVTTCATASTLDAQRRHIRSGQRPLSVQRDDRRNPTTGGRYEPENAALDNVTMAA